MTTARGALGSRIRREVRRSLGHAPAAEQLLRLIRDYLDRPAGLVRPRILAAAAGAYRAGEPEAVLSLGAATELLHVFALFHDDSIDEDTPRAGSVEEPAPDGETGQSRAIASLLAGDLLHSLGWGLIAETVRYRQLDSGIIADVREVAGRTILGQLADVRFLTELRPEELSFQRLYELYDQKTGAYTVAAPLRIGARLAGVADGELETLSRLAEPLGRAFQLRDDLEDLRDALETDRPVPPWELKLAATWLAHAGGADDSSPAGTVVPDPGTVLPALDMEALTEDVERRREDLLAEAEETAGELALPPARRGAFFTALRRVLRL